MNSQTYIKFVIIYLLVQINFFKRWVLSGKTKKNTEIQND